MELTKVGAIKHIDENCITIEFDYDVEQYLATNQCDRVFLKFLDARVIAQDQRKKIFAMIGDISEWSCCDKEYSREVLTGEFCFSSDIDRFSLSTVDMSTATRFIQYLIEFCLKHSIPCKNYLIKNCEDITHYLYHCLLYKRCAVCGRNSEFHHCTGSRAGMGRNSVEIPLKGLEGLALCRVHHNQIHSDAEQVFYDKFSIEPIVIDATIASKYPHYSKAE